MPKYSFIVDANVTLVTTVEADDLKAAIAIAKKRDVQNLCETCSPQGDNEWTLEGNLDCDVADFELMDLALDGVAAGDKFQEAQRLFNREDV
jgi:hypothetical protein